MRLHHLTVTAFGPFRDEQVVDFETLSATGLFLLTGDTGAGKTSVLDAVAYALYGRVAGSRASATRIRSDHADADRATLVQLELTLRGRRMRVTRAPEWNRPKVRGTGTTKQPTKVTLERLVDGQWEVVSNRADEVGHELGELLGMNHQQFCQVVLLPQGDFAQFLRADAETRKQLLERLFGTERFSAVEGWLVERRRERGQALNTVNVEVAGTIARLAEVTGDPTPPEPHDPAVVTAWMDTRLATVDAAFAAAGAALTAARSARSAAEGRLGAERALAERQERLTSLQARVAVLVAQAPRIDQARVELVEAQRVVGLAGLLDAVTLASETATARRAEAIERVVAASSRTGGSSVAPAIAELGSGVLAPRAVAVLEQAERDVRAEIIRLEALVGDEERLIGVSTECQVVEDEVADLDAEIAGHRSWLAAEPERTRALEHRREALAVVVRDEPAHRAEHDALEASIRAAAERDRRAEELAGAAEHRRDAVEAAQRARQTWQDLRERRLQAMAGELAAALTDGTPCPVCGGTDHPAPAQSAAEAVKDAAREDAALDAYERAERARDRSGVRHDEVAAALQAATVAAGGADAATVLAERRDVLTAQLGAAAAATTELAAADRDLLVLREEADRRRKALTSLTAAHARAAQRVDGLRESTTALRGAIDAARGGDPTVTARIARLTAGVDSLVGARDAVHRSVAADADLASQIRGAERAAMDAGFADLDAAADARRDSATTTALAAAVRAHDHESVLVASGLGAVDLVGTPLEPLVDLAAAERAVTTAVDEADRASAEVGRHEASAVSASRLAVQLSAQLSARGPLEQAYTTVDGLSRLAEGTNTENRLRMRLSYFVLSARLEQVAAAASERLMRMTDGRFSLVHSDDRAAGNQRSGLGLAVCDAWYGTTRDPATLSGGESFMASLALALGLADVVVAEAGGAFMDTLFVDEGFGSLDEATLDAVLDVLDGLREGGRAVGLVSHVDELRQRIPAQLSVRRGRSGSTLTLSA